MQLSIIIPVHNRADLLAEAIGSIIAQGLDSYEIIICDDGSTENIEAYVQVLSFLRNSSDTAAPRKAMVLRLHGIEDYLLPKVSSSCSWTRMMRWQRMD